jgi:hypothetical protein
MALKPIVEIEQMNRHMVTIQNSAIKMGRWQCCLNCINFVEHTENINGILQTWKQCDLYKQVPPPHVIAVGCESHHDDIPF